MSRFFKSAAFPILPRHFAGFFCAAVANGWRHGQPGNDFQRLSDGRSERQSGRRDHIDERPRRHRQGRYRQRQEGLRVWFLGGLRHAEVPRRQQRRLFHRRSEELPVARHTRHGAAHHPHGGHLPVHHESDARGRQQGHELRQIEGQAHVGRPAQDHVQRRGGGRRSRRGARRDQGVSSRTPSASRVSARRIPKGVLLVGPPGTGKTLLARAVAGEAGVPFFSISGSEFVEMFVGVGASRVRDLFEPGQAEPALHHLHRRDRRGRPPARRRHRAAATTSASRPSTSCWSRWTASRPTTSVIIMAATNRPDMLDPALLRPGRFDRQIIVDLPIATAARPSSQSTPTANRSQRESSSTRLPLDAGLLGCRPGQPGERGGPACCSAA